MSTENTITTAEKDFAAAPNATLDELVGTTTNTALLPEPDAHAYDEIATGGSIAEASRILKSFGAGRVRVGVTHAVFSGRVLETLGNAELDEIVVTDTIPIPAAKREALPNLKVLSTAAMFGDAILRIHGGRSISEMMALR